MQTIQVRFIGLLAILGSINVMAATTPIGNLEMWWDETPVQMGPGKTTWKGKASIPMVRDETTGNIEGKGSLPTVMHGGMGCTIDCNYTNAISVSGKETQSSRELQVTSDGVNAACVFTCPKMASTKNYQWHKATTQNVSLPLNSNPLKTTPAAGGPAIYYKLSPPCESQSGIEKLKSFEVSITPGIGAWEVTRMTQLTLDDIRREGQPNPDRYGYTHQGFEPKLVIKDKVVPAKNGKGFCYWVENVDFSLKPITQGLPGITYSASSCEFQTIAKHEEKHVVLYKSLMDSFASDFSLFAKISGIPAAASPIQVSSQQEGHDQSSKKLEDLAEKLQRKSVDERIRQDAIIDSRREYDAIKAAIKANCSGGWR